LFDLQTIVESGSAAKIVLTVRGTEIEYDVASQQLKCKHVTVSVPLQEGKFSLRVIGDQGSLEIFINRGESAVSLGDSPRNEAPKWQFSSQGGEARLRGFTFETWQPTNPKTALSE
jgi:sucrose-6-phosphate hydrolase SacC (GH32 family)